MSMLLSYYLMLEMIVHKKLTTDFIVKTILHRLAPKIKLQI